jgi:hypothetical protein
MESETRMIGGYNCFKATAVIPVNRFPNLRSKGEEGKVRIRKKKEDKENQLHG